MTDEIVCFDCDKPIGGRAYYIENDDGSRTWFHAACVDPWRRRQRFKPGCAPVFRARDPIAAAEAALAARNGWKVASQAPPPAVREQIELPGMSEPARVEPKPRDGFERVLGRKQKRFGQ